VDQTQVNLFQRGGIHQWLQTGTDNSRASGQFQNFESIFCVGEIQYFGKIVIGQLGSCSFFKQTKIQCVPFRLGDS
jgi:hypothetical protein